MSQSDSLDKSYDPTPKKLEDARKKGDVAKSIDLQTFAAYLGFSLSFMLMGPGAVVACGSILMHFLERPAEFSATLFGSEEFIAPFGGIMLQTVSPLLPFFVIPAVLVILAVIAQRAFVFAPSKLQPKFSRISITQNAKQKFGISGLFEFAKSSAKLIIYSLCLALFLRAYLPEMTVMSQLEPAIVLTLLSDLIFQFLMVVLIVSFCIGGIDAIFQHNDHIRKNRMSRKEVMDELKESDGDPYMKEERKSRAHAIASAQMMSEVPKSDVVIVNPTHYAVALAWSREPGSAPRCIAKGVENVALKIREVAQEQAIPIHSDPPTARALYASVELGDEISEEYFQAVAAAIRFADEMRGKVKARGFA